MPQIEARCAQAHTYDDDAWVLLFLFFERVITAQDRDVAPEALVTAMQSAATPTGQAIIRQAFEQPYLRDFITRQAAQRRRFNPCVIS